MANNKLVENIVMEFFVIIVYICFILLPCRFNLTDHGRPVTQELVETEKYILRLRSWFRIILLLTIYQYIVFITQTPPPSTPPFDDFLISNNIVAEELGTSMSMGMYPSFPALGVPMSF